MTSYDCLGHYQKHRLWHYYSMEHLENSLLASAKVRDNLFRLFSQRQDTPHHSCIELKGKLEYIVTNPHIVQRLGPINRINRANISLFSLDPFFSHRMLDYDTKCAELQQFINETNKNSPVNFVIPEKDTVRYISSGYLNDGKVRYYLF